MRSRGISARESNRQSLLSPPRPLFLYINPPTSQHLVTFKPLQPMMTPAVVRTAAALRPFPVAPAALDAALCSGACNLGIVRRPGASWRCHALSKHSTQDYSLGWSQNGLPTIEWQEKPPELDDVDLLVKTKEIPQLISEVKAMLGPMGDGEISISAYDTAWVALVRDLEGKGGPQFPSSLQWIANNQLADGSWGDDNIFLAHDRMINTLACVIALSSWGLCAEKCQRGLVFLCENMWRLGEEDATVMPIGFEVAFPSLMEKAKGLGLDVPYDDPALQNIYMMRNLKLLKIPREVLHKVPTTLLHSLEGMADLDWGSLLGLQCLDGSFLFSPSSTAYALEQTGDKQCLHYLERIVDRFNGGVPNVYPVDLFEHLWIVDRLERLGISRYFEQEIREFLDYIYMYWTGEGICWARNSVVQDVDDTSMGFRLLRLHGYNVSSDVFKNFEKDDEFFCFAGQSNQAVTGIYNLNRAAQVMFPGEEIMERAKKFSYRFLRDKQASGELMDKWIITKDLPGEVEYTLDFPWYASLPRIETRMYIEQYGGGNDVWIGKTLYRMPYVNNDLYLELAKSDFNKCQAVHQLEWIGLQKWYEESGLVGHGVTRKRVLRAYFVAASCIYEPERGAERLGWAHAAVLAEAISSHLSKTRSSHGTEEAFMRNKFMADLLNGRTGSRQKQTKDRLVGSLLQFIDHLEPVGPQQQHSQAQHLLKLAWEEWLLTWNTEDDGQDRTGLLLVRTIEACGGRASSGEPMAHPIYQHIAKLTSSICHRLSHRLPPEVNREIKGNFTGDKTTESEMQELARCVLESSDGLSKLTKQTFHNVTKSYYYIAHCPSTTLSRHIAKVLFQRVI